MFHHKRKLIAWLLVVVMILTLVPVSRTSSLGASATEMPTGESPDVTIGEAADAAEVTELEVTEKSTLTEEETEAVTEEETETEEIESSEEVTEETDKSEDPDTEEASTEEISTVETSEEEVVTEATEEAVTEEASTEEPLIVVNPIEENEFVGASGTASITCIVSELKHYAPYGEGNPKIMFHQTFDVSKGNYKVIGDGTHFTITFPDIKLTGFGLKDKYEDLGKPDLIECIGHLSENWFRGNVTYQFEIVDLAKI